MRQLDDFSDPSTKGVCIHCGESLEDSRANREHAATKALLNEPYPENLSVVNVHEQCNSGFSLDEEYLAAFLGAVISGSTEPDPVRFPKYASILNHNPRLRNRIDQVKTVQGTLWGDAEVLWAPELDRVERVIVKNAKAYALYEIGEPMTWEPSSVGISPLSLLSDRQRDVFESLPDGLLWPEVGSRMMQRMVSGNLQPGGWVEVQPGVYRYAVFQTRDKLLVRLVLCEYLAAEVAWDDSSIG